MPTNCVPRFTTGWVGDNANMVNENLSYVSCIRAFYKIPQNSLPAVLLHMAGAFFIIPHTNTLYHIFLPCFLNITSAVLHMAGAFFIIPHTNTLYHIFLPCFLNITSAVLHMAGAFFIIPHTNTLYHIFLPCFLNITSAVLHMAGAFFIIPHTNTLYHIFLLCFLNITSAITHGRCILHNSTICCGILWNCIFIVVLYGCSSKFHNCGTLWNEPFFL